MFVYLFSGCQLCYSLKLLAVIFKYLCQRWGSSCYGGQSEQIKRIVVTLNRKCQPHISTKGKVRGFPKSKSKTHPLGTMT